MRLYDLSIQNLAEMKLLSGLEEDLELQQENDAKTAYFKAMRSANFTRTKINN